MRVSFRKVQDFFSRHPKSLPIVVVVVVAVAGVFLISFTRAATPFITAEPENGSLGSVACAVSDSNASGGQAVKFSSSACSNDTLPGLSRIPWEGGPQYWAKFSKAAAAGWTNPNFFPITVFLGKPSPEYVALYKSAGVNTYAPPEHDPSVNPMTNITNNGMYAIAGLDWTPSQVGVNTTGAVGWFLSDECDMGMPPECSSGASGALKAQQGWDNLVASYNDGRFDMANFGNGILRTFWSSETNPLTGNSYMSDQVRTVDVASADKYTYTSPDVATIIDGVHDAPDWPNGVPVARAYSYGWQADQMRRFQNPNDLHPVWTFVESAQPYLGEQGAGIITPEQMEGAVWSALIHEARGISYFDHNSNDNGFPNSKANKDPNYCQGGYAIPECANLDCTGKTTGKCTRSTIKCASTDNTCGDSGGLCVIADVHCFTAAVDEQVRNLAPVLNTQSYANATRVVNGFTYHYYTFNNGTDAMLKTYNGSAYIFAALGMHCATSSCTSGSVDATGSKTFTLPNGVNGTSVTVVGEDRTIPVSGGKFTDTFANEYTHHVYKVAL
jgi:hypothetical protein